MVKLFTLLWMAALCVPAASAQSASDATLQALLAEIKQMRTALETAAMVTPRMQLILQRMQIQQQTINHASQELREVQSRLFHLKDFKQNRINHVANLELKLSQESDPEVKKQVERELRLSKMSLDSPSHYSEADLLSEESHIKRRLQIEEETLREQKEKLNALDRALDTLAPKQP